VRFVSTHLPSAIERYVAGEGDELHPDARSLLLGHDAPTKDAFVLLHGLTASPGQLALFGRALHERGANVFIPRLPRHGMRDRLTELLAGLHEDELIQFATEAVEIGRGLGERLTVLGFSAGGMLAAWVAQHLEVDRVVAVAPYLGTKWVPRFLSGHVARDMLRRPNRFYWWHPRLRERHLPEHGYPRFPTHAVARAYLLGETVVRAAKESAPRTRRITIVLNTGETTVNNAQARQLARLWRSHGDREVMLHHMRLARSHDIMEPGRHSRVWPSAHAQLLALLHDG